jgi:hypothetical protein
MEIKLNISNDLSNRPVDRPVASRPIGPVRNQEAFENLDTLKREMDAIPVVRPEAVARGQELLSDVHYPPEQTIRSLATLFAMTMGSSK